VNGDGVDDLMISAPNAGQLYTIYGHPWLADDGSIKLANISGDNGFVIDGDLYSISGYTLGLSNSNTNSTYNINIPVGVLFLLNPNGEVIWLSDNTTPAVQALMQTDGNFVLYSQSQPVNQPGSAEFAVWATNTNTTGGAYLSLAIDGGLYIVSNSGSILATLNEGSASATTNNTTLQEANQITSSFNTFINNPPELKRFTGNGNNVVMLGDVNGDGFADVLSGGSYSAGVLIFGNSTTNLVDASVGSDDIIITVSNQAINQFLALGDINGDGLQDLGVIDDDNNFYVQLGSSNLPTLGSSIELSNVLKTGITNGFALGDYNGDGYDDVMLTATNYETFIYFGNAQGNLSSSVDVGSGVYKPTGDINGDGYSDFSYQSSSAETSTSIGYANGFNNLEISYGNSNKTVSTQGFLNPSDAPFYGTNTGKVVNQAGDFNGDGIPDMMFSTAQPVGLIVVETSDSQISFAYFNHLAIDWNNDTSVTLDVQTTTHTYSTSDEIMGLASYENNWFFAHSEDYVFWLSGSNISQDGENQFGTEYDYAKPQLVTANGNLYMIVAGWNSNNPYISIYNSSSNSWQSVDSSTEEDSLTNAITNTNGNDVVSAAIDSNIYIAWTHDNDLYYGYWDTNNSTYTQLNNISLISIMGSNAGDNDPLSMTALNGTLYLALRDGNNNAWMTTYNTNNSSASWSSGDEMMYVQGNKQIEAEENSITLSTLNGNVYATWYDVNEIVTDNRNVYLTKYNNSSSSWTNSLLLNNGTTPLDITGNGDFPGLSPFVWSGQTSVILGDTNQNASNSIVINGLTGNFSDATANSDPTQSPYSSLGNEITFIGDINGDGFDDILLSVPNYNNNKGGAFVVFGTDSNEPIDLQNLTNNENNTGNKSSAQGFAIEGLPSSLAGISISGGADVNGDGFEDFIIGAPGNNDNLTYVIFGSDFNNTVNQTGTIGDDVMIGTATGESFIGGEGDDQIYTNGGIDVVYAGLGDDFVTVNDTYFRRLDGGAGTDVLRFEGYNGQDWDLTTLSPGSRLRNFEIFVTENYGANTLTLNSLTVTQLSPTNTITVVMDAHDTLNLSSDFSLNGTVYQYNQKFDRYTSNTSGATVLLNRIPGDEVTETSQLVLTEEGSLVLQSSSGEQLWTAEKNGVQVKGAVQALMQTDGNFVLYNQVQPTTKTGVISAYMLGLSDENTNFTYNIDVPIGVLFLLNPNGEVIWQSPNTTPAVQALMQTDGNFVLYSEPQSLNEPGSDEYAVWSTKTNTKDAEGIVLSLAEDGGLYIVNNDDRTILNTLYQGSVNPFESENTNVILQQANQIITNPNSFISNSFGEQYAIWDTGTSGFGTYLQLGADGGLYIKNSSGEILSTLNSGTPNNPNISNPSRLNEQQELLSNDSLTATLTEIPNLINVTQNAPSTNTPTSNSTAEVASVSAETMTSYSFDESGNETAQSFASSFFSATASNPNAPTRISVSNPTANEADGEVEFTIQRTGDLDKYVQVHYITQDGRGKSGSDYNSVLGRAVFKPGETTKTVSVPLILDDVYTGTRDLGLLVTLEKESDTPLSDEFNLYIDSTNGQIRNWNHIIGEQPNSVMGGELEFRVTATDGEAQVQLYFEGSKEFNNYYIFNNETQQYEPFSGAQFFDDDGDGKNDGVILNLQDGSNYDIDGSENSIVFKRGFFADGEAPEIILDTAMYRFRSLDTQGAYLYVGAEEKESVLTNYSNNFVEEGLAFYVSQTENDDLVAFNRFRNT
ncbi:Calx-beta domain-containing protein, partial [Geminocystis sp. CENA526]|uniref:Calx-beta domain-containing protein n=1 Tax=Geminocystis sp. CENA526 TaxID=1355871 RepID=UPI003D6FEBE9